MTVRGTPVVRREDHALLTTGGLFVADRRLAGALHVAYVTSTAAHARLRSVDVSAARAARGVVDVVVAADLDGLGPEPLANPQLDAAMRRPLLATDRVRFVGEPIAAVVAETTYQAEDAVGLVEVDYELLPAVVDPEAALLPDAPLLFEGTAAGNRAVHLEAPGLEADVDGCEVVVEVRIVNNRLAPCPLEPRVAASSWVDGRLVHYSAGQGTHPVRNALARAYGLDPAEVRGIGGHWSGRFGPESRAHASGG